MRRLLLLGVVLVALLPACARQDRPEGIVERWLLSLNQGAAGRPDRYAPDALSQEIVPGWATLDPGRLDTVEVGRAAADPRTPGASLVPFRVVDDDGTATTGIATVAAGGSGARVTAIEVGGTRPGLRVPSEGGQTAERITPTAWLVALAAAGVLALLAVGVVTLVRRGTASVVT
ncbi:MAG TPA: hypothetical protein VK646_10905 [Actinomycetota bacterium]|nr:hypothetical protein [Actinomycetota bacterium]